MQCVTLNVVAVLVIVSLIKADRLEMPWGPTPWPEIGTKGLYSTKDLERWHKGQVLGGYRYFHRQRRSATHSDHPHTREGRCFGSFGSVSNFQSGAGDGKLPIFDIDPRGQQTNVPMPYNIFRSGNQPSLPESSSPSKAIGPYPFAYRIVGQY